MKRTTVFWVAGSLLVASMLLGPGSSAQGLDLFNAEALPGGALLVQHLNSYHNCCIPIAHEVAIDGFAIEVREVEPYVTGCWCECYFDVDLTVVNLPPGGYEITYIWDADANIHDEDWQSTVLHAEVPGLSPLSVAPELFTEVSDCHGGDSVPVDVVSFGALKARYR